MAGARVANIGSWGRRRRTILGVVSVAVGVAVVVAVAVTGISPGWALVAFVPFTFGMLAFMQAGKST
ncbi:MAG: hypothetical protein ACREM3_02480 [Candidatus Rokuibacteriota bacterium]